MIAYGARFLARARASGAGDPNLAPLTGSAANALCGDEIKLGVWVEGGSLQRIAWRARACAMTRVSAGLLAECVSTKTRAEILSLGQALAEALEDPARPLPAELDELSESRLFPSRRRCLMLPWDALRDALGPDG